LHAISHERLLESWAPRPAAKLLDGRDARPSSGKRPAAANPLYPYRIQGV
jgi:hypothetical protein